MKFLIIGYGSIGKRHARNIIFLGHKVGLLRHSRNKKNQDGFREYYSFYEALKQNGKIDGAIICSPNACHLRDVKILIKNRIPFLLEKPPATDLASTLAIKKLILNNRIHDYDFAFNLRYFPILSFMKNYLPRLGKVYSVRVCAGYFLPFWRKNIDYRKTCSAKKELGGGVHIELIHEIDYILWFFGMPKHVFAYTKKVSSLEISTEDICSAIFRYSNGSIVELHLDYLSHKYHRGCQIIAEKGTLEWNYDTRKVKYSQGRGKERCLFSLKKRYDFNNTYIEEVRNFIGVIKKKLRRKIGIHEAENVMRVVAAINFSSKEGKWISLKRKKKR